MRSFFGEFVGLAMLSACCSSVAAADQAPADCSGRFEARLIVLQVDELADPTDRERIVQAVRAVRGVLHAERIEDQRLLTVLADVHAERVTSARLVQYLELAGYSAKEADEKLRDEHARRLSGGNGQVIELPASAVRDRVESASPATAPAGADRDGEAIVVSSLAESLDPLRERFNADKGKPRFIALLSPT